ncbi:hypothetical protein LEP1GSC013_1288 [Leptospira interrogans serovar Valbuzzi str. Duyster]|nr:hypothetical protein LEP1GSC013_1288 [Leptospira interrogans serovar Valbuzzi str. Duyster]ENO73732.1 hypothetical protein LEP1GSC012_3685 [Leptospira interrogans serovar Valbuzzi str. Valbuzzi]
MILFAAACNFRKLIRAFLFLFGKSYLSFFYIPNLILCVFSGTTI